MKSLKGVKFVQKEGKLEKDTDFERDSHLAERKSGIRAC